MSAEIKQVVTRKEDAIASARNVLLEAAEESFEDVILVGICPDGTIAVRASKSWNQLRRLGALELAKFDTLKTL